jgi:hypothetical protein
MRSTVGVESVDGLLPFGSDSGGLSSASCVCGPCSVCGHGRRAEAVSSDGTRPEELCYDVKESIYNQIIWTVVRGASDINTGNNQLYW